MRSKPFLNHLGRLPQIIGVNPAGSVLSFGDQFVPCTYMWWWLSRGYCGCPIFRMEFRMRKLGAECDLVCGKIGIYSSTKWGTAARLSALPQDGILVSVPFLFIFYIFFFICFWPLLLTYQKSYISKNKIIINCLPFFLLFVVTSTLISLIGYVKVVHLHPWPKVLLVDVRFTFNISPPLFFPSL